MKKIHLSSLLLMVCLLLIILPSKSSAHAFIVQSNPAENEVLDYAPTEVSIQFNESIQPSFYSLKVLNDKGKRVDQNKEYIDSKNDAILKGNLDAKLSKGTYTIQWSIISSDGHPVKGTIPFQIGHSTVGIQSTSTEGYVPKFDMILVRWLQYLSVAILMGFHFFYLFIHKQNKAKGIVFTRKHKWQLWLSFFGLTSSILVELPLRVTVDANVNWLQAFKPSLLGEVLRTTNFGFVWKLEILSVFIVGIMTFLYLRRNFARLLSALILVAISGLLLAKVFLSHAASAEHESVAIIIDFIHVLAVTLWIGGLLALVLLLPKQLRLEKDASYWKAIRRFSYWGLLFVSLIILSGIYMSFQYIPTFSALFQSRYGQVLIAKIVLLFVMIGFAAFHHFRGKRKEKAIYPSVWWEFCIGLIVFILAAFLSNLPTGVATPGVIDKTVKTETGNVVALHITPNVIGKNEFTVDITEDGHTVKEIEQVTITLTCLDMDMGETVLEMTKDQWLDQKSILGVISMAGHWKVQVHALTKSLEAIDASFTIIAGSS